MSTKDMRRIGGEWWFLKSLNPFKRDATQHVQDLKERGYEAKAIPVTDGWAVYYK